MGFSYNKLWKLLIDKGMAKKTLKRLQVYESEAKKQGGPVPRPGFGAKRAGGIWETG